VHCSFVRSLFCACIASEGRNVDNVDDTGT